MSRRFLFLAVLFAGLLLAPAAQAAITVQPAQNNEGDDVVFTVTRGNIVESATASTKDGSAKAGSDYTGLANEPVNFGGALTAQVRVKTIEDGEPELDETFTLEVDPITGDNASAAGTIKNDDQPSLSIADVTVSESADSAKLTISSQAVSADVTVAYATADDTARAGEDFTATSGRATIKAGQGSVTFTVPIANDTVDEEDERFSIKLSAAEGASLGDADATVGITNDDGRLVSIGDIGVVEGDGEQTFARVPVQLSGATFRTVSLAFITIDGPAKAPRDYLARFGSVVFQPGQTTQFVDIAIAADDVIEPNEFFAVLIGQAQGAKILRDAAVVAISDDDAGDKNGADRDAPKMALTKPRLSGGRSIRSRVTCPENEQRCKGRLVLYATIRGKERRIGSKSFTLPGNAARTLTITIPKSMLTSGRRAGRLAVRAYMVTSDAADNVDTTTKSATLKLKRSR